MSAEREEDEGGGRATDQLGDDFLEELGTFLHLVLGSPQLDDVALVRRVGKGDDHLEAEEDGVSAEHRPERRQSGNGGEPQGTCLGLL